MTQEDFDGFTVNVFLDEDGEWLAHFVELPVISAFADSPDEAVSELKEAWEGVKESYRAAGEAVPIAPVNKNYSGQFNVRIDKRVHRALAVEAAQDTVVKNQVDVKMVTLQGDALLARDKEEVAAQLEQKLLQPVHQRLLEVALEPTRVFGQADKL